MCAQEAVEPSPFWTFSLRFYADPEVAKACIALQDGAGVDVNALLFVLWAATRQRSLSMEEVESIVAAVEDWRTGVVVPLRTARRSLRGPPASIDANGAAALRLQVKKVELEAERLQQEALYRLRDIDRLGQPEPLLEAAAASNIKAYAAVLRKEFDAASVKALLAGLRRQHTPGACA